MQCEMCGSEKPELLRAKVEGVILNVCSGCAAFGEVLAPVSKKQPAAKKDSSSVKPEPPAPEKETVYLIEPDYSVKIRKARESRGLKQEELAKKLALKESLIHAFESGRHEPSIDVARKIESFFGISLVKQEEVEIKSGKRQGSSEDLTLGDVIRVRKK